MTVHILPTSGSVGPGAVVSVYSDAAIGAGGPFYSAVLEARKNATDVVAQCDVSVWSGGALLMMLGASVSEPFSVAFLLQQLATFEMERGDAVFLYLVVRDHTGAFTTFGPLGAFVWEPSRYLQNLMWVLFNQISTVQQPVNDILDAVTVRAY